MKNFIIRAFDVRKVSEGSSIIDILVYLESCKGRKVYLDYRKDPVDGNFRFEDLDEEAREYLEKAGAAQLGPPLERLRHMNAPAVDFYLDKGVDLSKEPLEISLCAQHNNGGLTIDCWWQTNVSGLFAVGEVAASHGVYRPGGTALNAGQVGSTRAAQYIVSRCQGEASSVFDAVAADALQSMGTFADQIMSETSNVRQIWQQAGESMSRCGAAIRNISEIREYQIQVKKELAELQQLVRIASKKELGQAFRLRDMLISQQAYLSAMADYIEQGGQSRGSALYTDLRGRKPFAQLPDTFTFTLDDGTRGTLVQEVCYQKGDCQCFWRPVRPIPEDDDFFENVWRSYRENGNIL